MRLQLDQDLWDSVEDTAGTDVLPLTEEQRAELDYRLADLEGAPEDASSWEEVRDQLRNRLAGEKQHKRGA